MKVMRRSLAFLILLVLTAALVFAQTRDSVRIYVQSTAADPAHAVFFRESFAEEIEFAGYSLAYRAAASDYILNLVVRPNIILYDDGTQEQAPPGEKQFILQVGLRKSQEDTDIVSFSFPFTYLAEVEPYNQYLFYQIMSNLPYSAPDSTAAESRPEYRYSPREDEAAVEALARELSQARIEALRREEALAREREEALAQAREREEALTQTREEARRREEALAREVSQARIDALAREEAQARELSQAREEARAREEALAQAQAQAQQAREREVVVEREVEVFVEVEKVVEKEVVRDVPIEESDLWRNKWLYLRLSADFPVSYFQIKQLKDQVIIVPGATFGLELQFLPWMSLELDFIARFADVAAYSFIPGAGLQLKFPIKPARYLMLEPYLTGAYSINLGTHTDSPYIEAGGGLQLGVKGGQSGAWFFDLGYKHTLNEIVTKSGASGETSHWNRFVAALSLGYKLGFVNRGK